MRRACSFSCDATVAPADQPGVADQPAFGLRLTERQVVRGIDAYRRTWDLFFSWTRDPVVFDIIELHVVAGDDVGFAYALMRCAGREPDGRDIELTFRLTLGAQKIAGQWTVVHEHHSIPAES